MNLYNCFVKKDDEGKIEDLILIADSFSWSAMIFNSIFFAWFLFHKMWRETVFLVAFFIAIEIMANFIPFFGSFSFKFTIYLFLALNCRTWFGENLVKKRGYQLAGMVFGQNPIQAKIRAIKEIEAGSENFISPFVKAYPQKPCPFSQKLFKK